MIKTVWKYYAVALLAVLVDQALKLWVHFNMQMGALGQIKLLGKWFKLFYTLNPGMAFGIQFGFSYDKILLTVIRIVATAIIIRYIWQLSKIEKGVKWLLWGWTLVLGGAAGNGIDSIFYGKLLNNTPYEAPMSWFYGQVIDMLYIDIWSGQLPQWFPWFSGTYVTFLPVFNIADVVILLGVFLIIMGRNTSIQESQETLEIDESSSLEVEITENIASVSNNEE